MGLPVIAFRREASTRRWEIEAAIRIQPIYILYKWKLLLRLVRTASSRSKYATTPSSSRWLLIHRSTVVPESINFSTTAENGASGNSGNIILIIISIIVSGRHRLLQQRLLQRDKPIKTRTKHLRHHHNHYQQHHHHHHQHHHHHRRHHC